MRKNLFYLFALFCSISLFSACSDDDAIDDGDGDDSSGVVDDTNDSSDEGVDLGTAISSSIVGNYTGDLTVSVDEVVFDPVAQLISVERASSEAITLSINGFSFIGIEVGDVELSDCTLTAVEGENNTYSFTGTTSLSVLGGMLTAEVNGEGSFITGNPTSLTLDLTIDAVLNGTNQTVKVNYTGTRMTGSSNAELTSFTFGSDVVAETIIEGNTIKLYVEEGTDVSALTPVITVSDGATVTPASGEVQDFSQGDVTYTVLAADGTTSTYTVSLAGTVIAYDFEDWTVDTGQSNEDYRYPIIGDGSAWATCNQAVMLIKSMGVLADIPITYDGDWPVTSTTDAYSGSYAVSMESVYTTGGNLLGQTIPAVTAGTAFLGSFNAMAALQDPMATTSFGIEFNSKPVEVRGYYKYTPGTEFYDADGNVQEDTVDECALSAVLYTANNGETLNGSNIYSSELITAFSQFTGGEQEEYTSFSLALDYQQDYDETNQYKFAIIFAASKDGASYNAAVGSKLIVDEVRVLCE